MGLKEVNFSVNGWHKFPSGLIIQWGTAPASSAATNVNFPIAFPSDCFYAGAGEVTENTNYWYFAQIVSSTKTGFTAQVYGGGNGGSTNTGAQPFKWLAIGY